MNFTQEHYPQLDIGKGTYGKPIILSWDDKTSIKIGAYCSISNGAMIFLGGEHRHDWVTTYPFNIFWEKGNILPGCLLQKVILLLVMTFGSAKKQPFCLE